MTQVDPSRYKALGDGYTYGQSDGLFYDVTTGDLVLVKNGTVVSRYSSSTGLTQTATGSANAIEGDAVNGIGIIGYTSGTGAAGYFEAGGSGIALTADSHLGTNYAAYIWGDTTSPAKAAVRIVPQDADPSGVAVLGDLRVNTAGELRRCAAAGTPGRFMGVSSAAKELADNFNALATTAQFPVLRFDGVAFTGATGIQHYGIAPSGNVYGVIPKGAGQTLKPAIVANGLDIGGDQTTTEGYEIFTHMLGASGSPFIIGTDPAFYFKCKFEITDADGLDTLIIGFRRAEAQQAAYANYADYAGMGLNTAADPCALKIITEVNAGGTTVTDTTQTFTQGTAIQVKILVSAAGVVTYQHDIVTPGTLAAPTATAAFTFDVDDPVIPFFNFLNSANLADAVIIHNWEVGYQ